jgi:hypothetical protein
VKGIASTGPRRRRVVKAGLAVIALVALGWVAIELTRPDTESYMPTDRPGVTAPAGVTTTTGMSAIGIVSVRLGERRQLIVNLAVCNADRNAVDVAEDGTRVVLTARTTGGAEGFCSDGVTVSLTQDLGQRAVIDASSGRPLIVEPG